MSDHPPTTDADEWRYLFEERAAILEYTALMSRERAEKVARRIVGGLWREAKRMEASRVR